MPLKIFLKSPMMEITVALEEESERPPAVFAPKKETSAPIVPDSIWEKEENSRKEEKKEDSGKAIEQKLENLQSLLEQKLKQDWRIWWQVNSNNGKKLHLNWCSFFTK